MSLHQKGNRKESIKKKRILESNVPKERGNALQEEVSILNDLLETDAVEAAIFIDKNHSTSLRHIELTYF